MSQAASCPPSTVVYHSLAGFYLADQRRVHSRESDVGLWWRDDADAPLHRVAWVRDTGELYVVRLGPPEQGGGRVEVLAVTTDQSELEVGLAGWRDRCGAPGSLSWLRRRATALGRTRRRSRDALVAGAGFATAAATRLRSPSGVPRGPLAGRRI